MREYYVYIMTNWARTLYIGVTNDLVRRVYQHKQRLIEGFTKKYNITFLVYYETTSSVEAARVKERQLKGWLRARKIALLEAFNQQRRDLSLEWYS